MREAFDAELRVLLEKIIEMGGLAEGMVADAAAGLEAHDADALVDVHEREDRVNALQIEIDELAVRLTVTQQPVASDVRLIFVATRCAADVERVADQAVNVSGSVHHYLQESSQADVPSEVLAMVKESRRSFADALAAFITRDVALSREVLRREPTINGLRDAVFKEVLYEMITRPAVASSALSLLLISRNLERIGDLATNVAEEVVYLVEGRDIRHNGGRDEV